MRGSEIRGVPKLPWLCQYEVMVVDVVDELGVCLFSETSIYMFTEYVDAGSDDDDDGDDGVDDYSVICVGIAEKVPHTFS